jgi:hypothetical protein
MLTKRKLHLLCYLVTCAALIATPCWCNAQSTERRTSLFQNLSLGTRAYYGSFITPSAKLEYVRDSYTSLREFYLQYQVKGNKRWHQTHNNPQWGLSYLSGNTGSRVYIGNMYAAYAFLNLPLLRASRYTGSFRFGAGPGWVDKPYNVDTNPKNTIIGTKLNAFIHLMFQNEFKITPRIFLNANLGLMHVSNGGTILPNLGLNIPTISAGIRYTFATSTIDTITSLKSVPKQIQYSIYSTAGLKQWPWVGSEKYLINTLYLQGQQSLNENNKAGGGLMLFYDRTLSKYSSEGETAPPHGNQLQIGVFASWEHSFARLSFPMQAGVYVYNRYKSPALFQQVGLRYRFSKHVSTVMFLKTHMGRADFIHAGFGYHF